MSLQFFNPWIGRMNRQQFLLGAALCGAAIYLGTSLIKQPALVVSLNVFFGFMLFVFVMRRLADQRIDDVPYYLGQYGRSGEVIGSFSPSPSGLRFLLKTSAGLTRFANSDPMAGVLVIFFLLFIGLLLVTTIVIPFLALCGAVLFFRLLADGNPLPNQEGPPPIGFNFYTTSPATYPDALIERFDKVMQEKQKEEQDFNDQLIALKTHRKAKTGGVTPYVEFRGRG